VVDRNGILSILAGSLLAGLQCCARNQDTCGIPPLIGDILRGRQKEPVDLATTRSPSIEDNPMLGYRFMGNLYDLDIRFLAPPLFHDQNQNTEVLAAQLSGEMANAFAAMWGPWGIQLRTHFFLIFCAKPQPHSSTQATRSLSITNVSTPREFLPCFFLAVVIDEPLFSDMYSYPSPTSSSTDSRHTSSETRIISSVRGETPSQDTWITCPDVEDILDHFSIADTRRQNAFFQKSDRFLTHLLRNFYALYDILEDMDLTKHRKISFNLDGNRVTVQRSQVLAHFNWSKHSYEHKLKWYEWARRVARKRWRHFLPGITNLQFYYYTKLILLY
jgi:hypothetical protein